MEEGFYELIVLKKELYIALHFLNKSLCLPVDTWYFFDNIKNTASLNRCIIHLMMQDIQEQHFVNAMGLSRFDGFLDAIEHSDEKGYLWKVYGYYLDFQFVYDRLKQRYDTLSLERQCT
jgi:hypothetical protein